MRRSWPGSCLLAGVLLAAATAAGAANVNVPLLELYTRGAVDGGRFGFISRGEMDLLVEGGYKFGGRVVLSFSSTNLEDRNITSTLSFKSATIMLREILGLGLSAAYFIGEGPTFASGALFPEYFGTAPVATHYQGFLHFPESVTYEGIYTVQGTGLAVDWAAAPGALMLSAYLYQDSRLDADGDSTTFDPGFYSADLRAALNLPRLKLEAFAGATYPAPDALYGYLRGGLLFYAADATEPTVEFLAVAGIPRWAPGVDPFEFNLFYFLFEPRVRVDFLAIIPTFFWRPAYYGQESTGEQAFDVNLNLQIGRPDRSVVSGGLETTFVYQMEQAGATVNELRLTLAPYVQLNTSGVLWDFRISTRALPFDPNELIEVFLAVKAVF